MDKENKAARRLFVRVSNRQYKLIKAWAKKHDMSEAEVVRQSVEQFIGLTPVS